MTQATHWHTLKNYHFISIAGIDASKLLQGQLTCDINQLTETYSSLGAHCNPKGRMISSFQIARIAEESFYLRLHASIADNALTAINKYAVFSKASVEKKALFCYGLIGDQAASITEKILGAAPQSYHAVVQKEGLIAIQQDQEGQMIELWSESDISNILQQDLGEACDEAHWFAYCISQGIGEVRGETIEAFIPQEINFQLTDAISFTKGCYTGQEIIARMKYLGKLKKHMYHLQATTSNEIAPNTPLFIKGENKTIGHVVYTATVDEKTLALLCVINKKTIDENQPLVVGENALELTLKDLPYSLEE